ncbi:MAG: sigma-70 family RNA polymerase sigma factor [Deltaproteobacteria bacterium]|nr:sigma-70 family RNA polymerase sigma factor [Deltaproteobacteria bacterium]
MGAGDGERNANEPKVTIETLVGAYFDFIWRSLKRLGVREGDVDDLTQRVFLTAARKLDQMRPGAERAYLYAIAAREASHARRTYRRRGEESSDTALADKSTGGLRPDEQVDRESAKRLIAGVLDGMEEELRMVFVLFEVEEMTAAEIAELLEIPIGTAKSRLRRAREVFADKTSSFRLAPRREE